MPIYEYRCAGCDRSFEALMRSSDIVAQCPHCDSSTVTREMSTFAARSQNGNGAAAATQAIASSGTRGTGGCCGGGGGLNYTSPLLSTYSASAILIRRFLPDRYGSVRARQSKVSGQG